MESNSIISYDGHPIDPAPKVSHPKGSPATKTPVRRTRRNEFNTYTTKYNNIVREERLRT